MGLREEAAALRREVEKLEAQAAAEEERAKELARLGELWLPSPEDVARAFVKRWGGHLVEYAEVHKQLVKLVSEEREAAARQQRIEIRQRADDANDAEDFTLWCSKDLEPR